jgi:hypothetical protein
LLTEERPNTSVADELEPATATDMEGPQ